MLWKPYKIYLKIAGCLTAEMYDKKLKEYKKKQADLFEQMSEHSKADEDHHLTASKLLDICKRAESLFKSSEPAEKRVFLNFILQNSTLNARNPVFTLKPVFQGIVKAHETHNWGALVQYVRTWRRE
jgi:hypothetical protein